MTIQQMFFTAGGVAFTPQTQVITTSGAGSFTVPAGATSVTMEAIGGGGNGFGNATVNQRASGGGGQYSTSNTKITVVAGQTVYYSVGTAATDSWVRYNVNNTTGIAVTDGCLAKAGTSGSAGTAGVGNQAGGVGATINFGGNGAKIGRAHV